MVYQPPTDQHQGMHYYSPHSRSKGGNVTSVSMDTYDSSQKENQSTVYKPNTIKPGTNNVRHNVTSMLSNDVSQRSQLPVTSTSTMNIYQNIVPDAREEFWRNMQPSDQAFSLDQDTSDADSVTPDNSSIDTSSMADSPTSSVADSPTSSMADSPTSSVADSPTSSVADSPTFSMADSPTSSMADSPTSSYRSSSPLSTSTNPPQTGSQTPSPTSDCSSITSPETNNTHTKRKMVRTNYTPDQVRTLEKMFHENPYPDSETMEMVGHKMGVAENKIKIWFQNKRARWRRRVNTTVNNVTQHSSPMSQMMSPIYPYGYAPAGHTMTSPLQGMPGYMNYQGFHGSLSHNVNQFSFNHYSPNMYAMPISGKSQPFNSLLDSKTTTSTSPYGLPTSIPHVETNSQNGIRSPPQTMSSFTGLDTSTHLKHSQYQSYMNQPLYGMKVCR